MADASGYPAEPSRTPEAISLQRYFPLRAGYTWTYHERVTTPARVLLLERRVTFTVQQSYKNEHVAHWHFQSGATELPNIRYRVGEHGIEYAQLTNDTLYTPFVYLLKLPLAVGTRWHGLQGAIVSITALGVSCSVPAGSFPQCLETVQEVEPTPTDRMTTHLRFAPDVGLVWQQRQLFRHDTVERMDTMELHKLPEPTRL